VNVPTLVTAAMKLAGEFPEYFMYPTRPQDINWRRGEVYLSSWSEVPPHAAHTAHSVPWHCLLDEGCTVRHHISRFNIRKIQSHEFPCRIYTVQQGCTVLCFKISQTCHSSRIRKIHKEELKNLYSSPSVLTIKLSMPKRARNVQK
jgi:hypothetical protein